MNKLLTIINWAAIGLLTLFIVLYVFDTKKGGDAAGQGQGAFWLVLAVGALVLLLVLNLLPFHWGKYAGLAIPLLPFFLIGFDTALIEFKKIGSYNRADNDGSRYFPDPQRKAIAEALSFDKTDQLERLLREPVPLINDSQNSERMTLLDYAARSYSPYNTVYNRDWKTTRHKLELLLKAGARIDNRTPNHVATHAQVIDRGPVAMLRFFLDHGADPNAKGIYGMPLLFDVIHRADEPLEKIQVLLDHGVTLTQTATFDVETEQYSPLLLAAHFGRWEICQLLIQKEADLQFIAPNGATLTHYLKKQEVSYASHHEAPSPEFTAVQRFVANSTR